MEMDVHEMLAMKAPITFEIACKAWETTRTFATTQRASASSQYGRCCALSGQMRWLNTRKAEKSTLTRRLTTSMRGRRQAQLP